MSNITDNMYDLGAHFMSRESYHDFEGLADAKQVLKVCKDPKSGKYVWDEIRPFDADNPDMLRSLLLAFLYERADTYGMDGMNFDKVVDLWEMLLTIGASRWYSKVTDQHIKDIENAPDDPDEVAA